MISNKYKQPNQQMEYSKFIEITFSARYRLISNGNVAQFILSCLWNYYQSPLYGNDETSLQNQLYFLIMPLTILLPLTLIQNMFVFTKVSAIAN
ncbi:unnamed protein product [Paramecium pentaurelia]|uniref:Uncharacterized protein n=1 Tax=Paramecium pentaurelia TaxID=43138 RepID=A0A8S1VX12_9CILI|nr:unnamed protein product [Paramecium pentaurelia]